MANENIQELKFQVGEAWKGVYSSSTAYGLANVVQDSTGLSVYRSLKSGNVGHPVSDRTWWFCIIDMSSIKSESDRIAALNQTIAQDEALRVAAEELRQQHEEARIAAETQRNEAEQARINAEQQRVTKETQRNTAEQNRITAEQGRVSAESARVQAEQARALAETLRANAEDARASNEQNRVAAEQQRIANEQTRETQYAADHTRAEADHETAVQDNAQMTELVERADADHSRAESDHITASSDHSRAEGDHTTASSDHTRAEGDHTTSASDHETAASDHTRAESDHAAVEVYVDSLGAFNISAYHATDGVLAKYADLAAALGTNGANIPDALRKGGMSVKFVQSSDNKYVQYRLMSDEWSTTVANWQGVDDIPTNGSNNLVKSGGVVVLDNGNAKNPFTKNYKLNKIIKELYLKYITKENIENVYKVRVYNGYYTQSGNYLYGISIYITSLSYSIELYDSVTSPYTNIPSLYIKGQGDRWYGILDVSHVNNGEYKDFDGAVLNTYCLDTYYSPSIQLYINNPAKCERFPVSDNLLLNSVVKELWVNGVTSEQLSNAYKVRIYNGFQGSDNKYLYGITIYITGLTYTIEIIERLTEQQSILPTYIVKGQNDRWKAILNLSLVPSGTYIDVNGAVFNTTVLNINYSPTIIALDIKKETGTFAKFTPSNNNTFNNIVKELFLDYITTAQLESIVMIRIYNCAAINNKYHSGFTLYNSDYSYTIDGHKSFDTLSEAEEFISSPVIVTGPDDRIQAVIDWDKVTKGSYLDIRNFALYPICRNINFWESLKQHGTLERLDVLEEDNHAPYFKKSQFIPYGHDKVSPLVYVGDTKSQSGFINNAVSYPNGEIIACRQNGKVVRIATNGTETTLLTIQGASEWRLCWIDSNMNVYVSPHSSFDRDATLQATDRGLYKLAYGSNTFVKVLSLYNPSSPIPTEAEVNDDTIWTMTEDRNGNLYAGVYAHTIHANPSIYKSTDGGNTWSLNINFNEVIYFRSGRHIHAVEYNKYDNCLYAIIGEINNIAKSDDYGETWTATGWACEGGKGTTLLAVPDGLLVGSDTGYSCIITKIYADEAIKTVGKMWANIVFAMRRSDLTGYLYALTRVDSSVSSLDYYPSAAAVGDAEAIQEWKDSSPSHLSEWEEYNDYAKNIYPDDAERPHECAILISKDNGETWEILKKIDITYGGAAGFIMAGQFINGECVLGFSTFVNGVMHFVNPYIISEGKHRFTNDGKIDLSGDIFVKINTSDKVTP